MFYGNLFNGDFDRLKDLTRSEILVYTYLISYGGKDRAVARSHSKIAKAAGVSVGSLKRAIKKFEDLGWLSSSEFYQVKKYQISKPDVDLGQHDGLDLGQHNELPNKKKVGQHVDIPLGQHDDLPIDQYHDLHVKENIKENNIYHVHETTNDEKVFLNLLKRWNSLLDWNIKESANLLAEYRKMKLKYKVLDFELEIKVIDSWLLMQHYNKTERAWKNNFMGRIDFWFKKQVEQGARSKAVLSRRQQAYFQFAVTADCIPEINSQEETPAATQRSQNLSVSKHLETEEQRPNLSEDDQRFIDSLPRHQQIAVQSFPAALEMLKRKYGVG